VSELKFTYKDETCADNFVFTLFTLKVISSETDNKFTDGTHQNRMRLEMLKAVERSRYE